MEGKRGGGSYLQSLLLLLRPCNSFLTHDTSAPRTLIVLMSIGPVLFDGRLELGQFGFILGADFRDGDGGSGLFCVCTLD